VDVFPSFSPSGDLGVLALGLGLAGIVGGLVTGVLGFGGSIVIVPVLYSVLVTLGVDHSTRMHIAVATSLAAFVPASLPAAFLTDRPSVQDRVLQLRRALAAVLGALVGGTLVAYSSDRVLMIAFATVSLVVAFYFAFGGDSRRGPSKLPQSTSSRVVPAVIGGVSAMTGMDGGTLGAPAVMLFGTPPEARAQIGAAFNVLIATVGAACAIAAGWRVPGLPAWSLGYVNLVGLGLVLPGMLLAVPVAARFAQTADMKRMRLVFALFVAIAGARFLFDALT
jgi:uncharacterized membrane protein YfcA